MSWLDDLSDPAEIANSEARLGTTSALPAPGFFAGTSQAIKGVPKGLAEAVNATDAALRPVGEFLDPSTKPTEGERISRENVARMDREIYDVDPQTTGTAGQVLYTLAKIIPRTAVATLAGGPIAGGIAAGAPEGYESAQVALEQGIDPNLANTKGIIDGTLMGVGALLPGGHMTKAAIPDAALVVGGNVALGMGGRKLDHEVLLTGGYTEQAEQYKAWDARSMLIDGVLGAAFWGVSRASGPTPRAGDVDAALSANQAHHAQVASAPGVPATPAAAAAHHTALSSAIRQTLEGAPVNVASSLAGADFLARPASVTPPAVLAEADPGTGGVLDAAVDLIVDLESGGRADAKNPRSTATGVGQFTEATWITTLQQHRPDLVTGRGRAEVLAMRTDGDLNLAMTRALTADNMQALRRSGVDPTPMAAYLAHHFGPGRVPQMLAQRDAPMASILSPAEIKANPAYRGKTVGQVIASFERRATSPPAGRALEIRAFEEPEAVRAEYAAIPESEGGTVLNTDIARELSPEYLADRSRSADVHEAASQLIKDMYVERLARPTPEGFDPIVRFTAGGTGAGKSTSLTPGARRPEITYDTNMNTLSSAVTKIELALKAKRAVEIDYTFRDPVEALRVGALSRAMRQERDFGSGRTVPLSEHAGTHTGSADVIRTLAERYAGDSRVSFGFTDNSHGKGNHRDVSLADLPKVDQNGLNERLRASLDEAHAAGEISDAVYRGFLAQSSRDAGLAPGALGQSAPQRAGRARGGSGGPAAGDSSQPNAGRVAGDADPANPQAGARRESGEEVTVLAAADAVAESPNLAIIDDDGNAVSAADALARADAEIAQADIDAAGFLAAAQCFLRGGE